MITFNYSLIWDIRWFIRNIRNKNFLKKIKVVVFPFRLKNYIIVFRNLLTLKNIKYKRNITVYFLTSGTTGAYSYPDKIFICPLNIEKFGGLKRVLSHELAHLELGEIMETLSHEEKENKVKILEKDILNFFENYSF
jgi:hypothetical protein